MAFFANIEQYKKPRKRRKGIHAKTKTSRHKGSKLYKKI